MPNMSYCRFENTYNDLIDCLDNINNEAGNERDERYRIRLIKLIADNMDLISDLKDIEPEYQQSQFTMYIHGIKLKHMNYSKHELQQLDTIEQAWDGSELKIENDGHKVWLTQPEHRKYDGDYVIETRVNGKWEQQSCLFDFEYINLPYIK